MMRRITPEEVVEAYEKTGLKPRRRTFGYGECGCGLTALCMANGRRWDEACFSVAEESLGVTYLYSVAFSMGFDGKARGLNEKPEYIFGYSDGAAAAALVFGESPCSP